MIIELMIWELLGVEEVAGRTITDKTTPSWLVDRLKRLAKRSNLEPSLASEIVEFAQASKTMFNVRNDNLHNVWVSLEEGKVVRLRSVLVDGTEGPEFNAEVAVAGVGQLATQADIMETFAQAGYQLLERLHSR